MSKFSLFVVLFMTTFTAFLFDGAKAADPALYTQRPRVIAVNFNPIIPSEGYQRLHVVYGWNNPNTLNDTYISDMASGAHDIVQYRLLKKINADLFPVKYDGFRYTDEDEWTPGSYLYAMRTGSWHSPDGVDYKTVIRDFDLARRCDKGEVDEVFMQGAPYFGYWESQMVGKGAYWCNSSGLRKSANANKFIIMGFNYERGPDCTAHDYGHRAESIMSEVYDGWNVNGDRTLWDRFAWNIGQTTISSIYGVGSCHYPCNADSGYDYANPQSVTSYAIDWMNNFPNLTGQTSTISRDAWGGPDYHRNYMIWFFSHMPHVAGRNSYDGYDRLNNWWAYTQDLNRWPESRGDMIGSSQGLPAGSSPIRITSNDMEDFRPQINSSGRIAWSGDTGDLTKYDIYSANIDGTDLVQICNLNGIDEDPKINSSGRIVWQNFFNGKYEIYCADSDGTDLVQITDNDTFDWHPEINDSGRIVWDRFDEKDLEIYSANSDGTDIVRITDNEAASGMPRDDCWAQINNSGRIVWMGYDGGDWEIYSANSDGTDIVQITDNYYDDEYPQINDSGRVVWHCFHSTTNTEIYSANSDGTDLTRITNDLKERWHPQINNSGQIVWMGHDGSDWEIWRSDADGGNSIKLTNNSAQDMYPVIDDDGRIVWQGLDKNDAPNDQNYDDDWEIYAYIDGTIYQITDNDIDDRAPTVTAGTGMAWHGDAGALGEADIFVVNDADTDADGLPDIWEMSCFGDLNHGPDDDDDVPQGDGATNYEEYIAGTDPTDPSSVFAIIDMRRGSITIEWSSVTGRSYTVYYSDEEYSAGMQWTIAESSIPASGTGTNSWTDESSLDGVMHRFYKVMVHE